MVSRRVRLAFWLPLVACLGACSKNASPSSGSSGSGGSPGSSAAVVVAKATFGSAEGQIGKNVPPEGAPVGPRSFVVDSKSRLFVLDDLNDRIDEFAGGKSTGSVPIPAGRAFDDIELDGHGGFVLLDAFTQPALVFLDSQGNKQGEVPLQGTNIPEPSLITALVRGSDGYYVELEDAYLVKVADASGAAVDQSVVPGQALDGTTAFDVDFSGTQHLDLYSIQLPDGTPTQMSTVSFNQDLAERLLFAPSLSGGLLLAVHTVPAQVDPESPPPGTYTLVVLDKTGAEQKRVTLPAAIGLLDVFRPIRRGDDGNVYVMTTSDSDVQIAKVTP
jgi:hypothetical protein